MVYRYSKAPSQRQLKVSEEIRHALSDVLIKNELSHPFFEKHIITVSQVRISQDLKMATAFMAFPKELDENALLKMFNEIAPTFRKLITKKINLKFSPEIRFTLDESIKTGSEVDEILQKLK
jgi:ribosome-binding factor A